MNLVCDKTSLEAAVVAAARAARPAPEQRSPDLPILDNILLCAADGRAHLHGTNLHLAIQASVPAAVREPGAVTIPARPLADLLHRLPAGQVQLQADVAHVATLTHRGTRFTAQFAGIDAEEFPRLPTLAQEDVIRVDGQALARALRRVLYAASADATRGPLTCVRFRPLAAMRHLHLAAADGYRAAATTCRAAIPEGAADFLLPARGLTELARLLPKHAGIEVAVAAGDPACIAWCGTRLVTTAPADPAFPDIAQFIPEPTALALPSVQSLARALACLPRDAGTAIARLTLDVETHTLRLDGIVEGAPAGGMSLSLGPGGASGNPTSVEVRLDYLQQALATLDTYRAELRLSGPTRAAVLHPEGRPDHQALIMPITRPK